MNLNPPPVQPVISPCMAVCRMNSKTKLCDGCWRTIEEIADWGAMSDTSRRRVLEAIEQRRREIGPRNSFD